MGWLLSPYLTGTPLSLFSWFCKRSGCRPATTPSATSQHPSASLRNEPVALEYGYLTYFLFSWALKAKSEPWLSQWAERWCFSSKKGMFVLIKSPFWEFTISPYQFPLQVQISWTYVREYLEGIEGRYVLVLDLHSHDIHHNFIRLHLILSYSRSWVPSQQPSSAPTFWECGLSG